MPCFLENTFWIINGHHVCNLLSNASEKNVCVYVYEWQNKCENVLTFKDSGRKYRGFLCTILVNFL